MYGIIGAHRHQQHVSARVPVLESTSRASAERDIVIVSALPTIFCFYYRLNFLEQFLRFAVSF